MFQFITPAKIIFGVGALENSLSVLNKYGYSVLLVTGETSSRAAPIIDYITNQKMRYQHVSISGEPHITMVEETATVGRKFKPDMVVAIGGGSVIDMGKALSAIIPSQGNVYDYVEVVGRNVPLKTRKLPFIAIPTTASTGAEVTNKAVLRSGQDSVKVSLRSNEMFPELAIVDPSLTYNTNSAITGRGAMETFTHLMEAYVCNDPNLFTDMVCEKGLESLALSIGDIGGNENESTREGLAFAATLGGVAISNAKLGAAHGLASSLGGKLSIPHSVIAARLAPFVMEENIKEAKKANRQDILNRYSKLTQIITQDPSKNYADAVEWVHQLLERLHIPCLVEYGVCTTSFSQVAKDAMKSTSIKGNPIPLTETRLSHILKQVCSCAIDGDSIRQGVSDKSVTESVEINDGGSLISTSRGKRSDSTEMSDDQVKS